MSVDELIAGCRFVCGNVALGRDSPFAKPSGTSLLCAHRGRASGSSSHGSNPPSGHRRGHAIGFCPSETSAVAELPRACAGSKSSRGRGCGGARAAKPKRPSCGRIRGSYGRLAAAERYDRATVRGEPACPIARTRATSLRRPARTRGNGRSLAWIWRRDAHSAAA